MEIGVLGPLEVTANGRAIEIGGARLRASLTRLALSVGRAVTVEELSDALWPEDKPADQVNAVRLVISRLRRSLPEPAVLKSVPGGYRLDLPPDAVDAVRFERLAREGRRALTAGDPETAARLLAGALRLWRGPALADAPFASAYAVGLEEARLAAIEDRAEAELACGRYADLVSELSEFAARHPLRERLQALRLRAMHAAGRQAEALAAYEEIRRRLAEELGADPGPELRETHLALLRTAPPRRAPSTLRTPLTSFIGRDHEVRDVAASLAANRLVTLVGPGGAGKTRLATTVAAGLTERGVWLVELAAVTDPGNVPQAVLRVLNPRLDRQAPPRDVMDMLVETLGHGQALLILDNCEHVVDAAARLADELLGRCPRLRVLATSREPLSIIGEVLISVPPLRVPEEGASPREALDSPAARLFADRAAAVRPGFEISGDNVAAVVEICRRLDGLPLAIELAAARLRTLTAPQLADRLDDRFRLLTGGSRTAMPRHQTLRAVVAWSWDLLDDGERRFAERVAVFAGGVTEAAAEWMGGSVELLTALVDKSLLQLVEADEPRYRMLETIREYGLEQLAGSGEITKVKAAHAAYFLALAETAEPYLRGRDQVVWLNRLMAERDNLLAALHFAADSGDADTAVRLAAALAMFWTVWGTRAEAIAWLRPALEVRGDAPIEQRTLVDAMLLLNQAFAGAIERLDIVTERFAGLAEQVGPHPSHPLLTLLEPLLALFTEDVERGHRAVEERLNHPDVWVRAMSLGLRAALRENLGDGAGARADVSAAIAGFREVGDRFGLSQGLTSLAEAHLPEGELDQAAEALQESIRVARELDPGDDTAHERILLAGVWAARGDVETARAQLRAIVEPTGREWSARNVAFARLALGDLARQEGDFDEAAAQYQEAADVIATAPFVATQFRALILHAFVLLAADRGKDLAAAEQQAAEAADLALAAKDMPVLARVAVALAALRDRGGDPAAAAELLGVAEQLRGTSGRGLPDVVRLTRRLRARLGDAGFDAAHTRGRSLSRAEAVAKVRAR